MTRTAHLRPEFVEHIPDGLEEGVLYVSMTFATAMHKCCCGCGREVVTPLRPTDWAITYNGESIWLDPSIGNWSFECQSHYWIEQGRVRWAPRWSRERIALGRAADRVAKDRYFKAPTTDNDAALSESERPGFVSRLVRRILRSR